MIKFQPEYSGHLYINALDVDDLTLLDRVREMLPYAESSNADALRDMSHDLDALAKAFRRVARQQGKTYTD